MKNIIVLFAVCFIVISGFGFTGKTAHEYMPNADTLSIKEGDTTEYEIIIIEPGFESWMVTNARPRWYYTQQFYENRNKIYVNDWNTRVIETMSQPPFEERIEYNPNVDYGLEVNYQLYWYFKYLEHKYGITLRGPGRGR